MAELVGDLLISCNGGTPTPANQNLRQVNIQIFTQPAVNITSRQLAASGTGNFSEALLFIDEPAEVDQTLCGSPSFPYSVPAGSGQTLNAGSCGAVAGTGNGIGTYNPATAAPSITAGSSSFPTYRGNAFQARQLSANSLIWQGVPFDPPGNQTTRVLRITNVRLNARQLGVQAGTDAPVQLFVSTNSTGLATPIAVPISEPAPTVARAIQSLAFLVGDPQTCPQNQSANSAFAANPSSPLAAQSAANPCDGVLNRLSFRENFFPSGFRRRNDARPASAGSNPPTPTRQDRLGVIYQTESGFLKVAANGNRWPLVAENGSTLAGTAGGSLGLADHGTRLSARFSGVPDGVQLWVEAAGQIVSAQTPSFGDPVTGFARLTATDSGAFAPPATSSPLGGIARVSISGGAGRAVWEVIETDTTAFERFEPRIVVAYIANASGPIPATGTIKVTGAYGPLSDTAIASDSTAPLPRFVDTAIEGTLFTISPPPTPPAAPTGASIGNGATGVPTNVTVAWMQPDSVEGWEVYFGTVNPPATLVATVSPTPAYTPATLAPSTTYYWKVVAKRGGFSTSSPIWSFTTAASVTPSALRFVPVAPCRVVDTREASFGSTFGTPALTGGVVRSFPIPQKTGCNIPADAAAFSINATVVPRGPLGYLTLWPAGQNQPFVSTLNSIDGRIKANAAIVPAGQLGAISVFATDNTELVIDINGYFVPPVLAPAALAFYPLPPCRILDTRNANGPSGGPIIAGGASRTITPSQSNCGIPANAAALSLNATVVPSGPLGYLTLWPTGEAQPFVSTLNAPRGNVVANAAIVPTGANGSISAFVADDSHLVVDINGYFALAGAANAHQYVAVPPCRLSDSRSPDGEFGGPILASGSERSYRLPLTGCGLPANAGAFVLNATVVPAGTLSYLTMWPFGSARPFVSTLNAHDASITSNMALVPAGTSGTVAAFVTEGTHLVLDTSGYFAP